MHKIDLKLLGSAEMPELEGSFLCFFDEKYPQNINIVIGGFLIPKLKLFELDSAIINAKRSVHLDETDPIKWNMDDPNCSESLRKIGVGNVPELKSRMFEIVNNLRCSLRELACKRQIKTLF
jgi:hypothetical protein